MNISAAPVNINKASAKEIAAALKGVGQKKSEAIVLYRQTKGKFSTEVDLVKIKGIGKKLLLVNKGDILFNDKKAEKLATKK